MINENNEPKAKNPLYQQIYLTLKQELLENVYNEGGLLPSEKKLCERFGVERNTVRKALQIMVDEGLVKRVPGCGTKILYGHNPTPPDGAHDERGNVLLLTRETNPLGSDVEYFHLKLIQLLEIEVSALGFNLIFKLPDESGGLSRLVKLFSPVFIIFDSYFPDSYYREALSIGVPCLSINHYTPAMTSVVSNNFDGAYSVARLLLKSGHRNIALITGKHEYQTTKERLSGFQSCCSSYSEYSGADHMLRIFEGNWLFDSGCSIGEKILALPKNERPTAVFAFNDDLAFGFRYCCENHGVSIPDDISIVGFDKSDRYARIFRPITTVDVRLEAMVKYACCYISSVLNQSFTPGSSAKIQIETEIIDNSTVKIIE